MRMLVDTISVCEAVFVELEGSIPDPVLVPTDDSFVFRYEDHTPHIVVVQKLSRIATGLRASLALLEQGLYQEVGALFRMLDEFGEDVWFMCDAILRGRRSALQERFIADFFQSEFDHENPLLATQRRNRVPRRQIQAAIARMPENTVNPHDAQEVARTIANAQSGYVHGTSEHILDMYGGDPPRYHLKGMLGTRRQTTFEDLAWSYCYRGLLAFMAAAGAFRLTTLLENLFAYRAAFEENWGRTEWESSEQLIRELRKANA